MPKKKKSVDLKLPEETPAMPEIEPVTNGPQPREWKFKRKPKVAIVGCSDTCHQTPFDKKDEFEFWGVNNLYLTLKGPWTRWFEIHNIVFDPMLGTYKRREKTDFRGTPVIKYLKQLQELNIPIYMRQPIDLVPNAVLYPIQDMINLFGGYFTNTISYMIALALSEGHYEEIHVYGVDMAVDSEYFWQRPSCEYFLGIAAGRGIKIHLPKECDLLKTRFLYGFDDHMEHPWMLKVNGMIDSMTKRHAKTSQKRKHLQKMEEQYIGGISAAHEMKKIWKGV